MKKCKRLLACLLAGVMMLTMLTACEGGLNLGVVVYGYKEMTQQQCEEIAEKMGMELTYSQDLCNKARSIASYLASSSVELDEAGGQLTRETSADASTLTYLETGRLREALDYSGNCALGFEDLGFGISYEVKFVGFEQRVYYSVPQEGMVTNAMLQGAVGKSEIGAAYIRTSNADYIVTVFR